MAVWKIGPALAAGNTVVLKPAESTPTTTVLLAEVAARALPAGVIAGGFLNAGQDCTAATRVIVQEGVHDAFVAELTRLAAAQVTGQPSTRESDFGPLNNADQFARVTELLERLPAHARVETGGHRVGEAGFFLAPTVVSGLRADDEIVLEEVFGPVMTVQRFAGEDEAVELANGVEQGLVSSVWTRDHARAMRVSAELDFGAVWLNTHGDLLSEMPHGGFKRSGYGKDLSAYSLEDYTRVKHVMSALD